MTNLKFNPKHPPRIAVIQHGDYRAAVELITSGQAEPYFGMRNTLTALEHLLDGKPHCIVSLDAPRYREQRGDALWLGIPSPKVPDIIPRTLTTLSWRAEIVNALRDFRPTHLLLRNGNPVICSAVLDYCHKNNVSVLVLLTNIVERWSGWHNRYFFDRFITLLNQPNVFLTGNHKAVAARSLIRHGVNPGKVLAWDFPVTRHPRSYEVKTLPHHPPLRIVYASAMLKSKGLSDLIEAVVLLRDERLAVELTAFGDGEDLRFFKLIAPGDIVHFAGRVGNDEIFAAMQNAALVCVPSRHEFPEAMPLVLTEALASRTPVVVSDHPVMIEGLVNGEGVRIAKSRDPRSFAAAIRRILTDETEYRRLSESTLPAFERLECKTEFGDVLQTWARARMQQA
jgi:glycosyltransferase involved in cell wall biosynthesis